MWINLINQHDIAAQSIDCNWVLHDNAKKRSNL